jgi:hypothetical protein
VRKSLVVAVAILMLVAPGSVRFAHAQSLDDAIDAELDDVSGDGNSPSTETKSANAISSSVDEIQLDDDGASAPKQTAKASLPPKEKPAPEPVAAEPEPVDAAATDSGPNKALVNDELKLDDAPAEAASDDKKNPVPDVELDTEDKTQAPTQAEAPDAPTDSAPDLQTGSDGPTPVVEEKPAPVIEEKPVAVAAPASAVSMDNGNPAYEKRLGQISRGYKPVADVNWDEIVADRRQENYRLQTGDTLWDISETFFGDGFFWAKLWSQNGVIENPHRILRGKAIRFVAGNESDAPAIGVVDVNKGSEMVSSNPLQEPELDRPTYREQVQAEVTPEEIESGVVLETDELIPAPDLPPASKRVAVLKILPKSFAETHIVLDAEYDSSGLIATPTIRANDAASVFVNSFILDGSPNEIGTVDEIETQERVARNGQGVFVKANKELPMGSRVTFIHKRDRPPGSPGPVVNVEGVGVVDGVIKESSNTYHVTVTTAIFPVEKGSLVVEEPPPRVTFSRNGRHTDLHAKVIGGEFGDDRKNIGEPSIIYLNAGSASGIQKGDIMGVQARRGTRRETKYPDLLRPIAVIKIADVRQKVATAIVLSSVDGIVPGDLTGGELPEDLPGLQIETADESTAAFGRKEPVDIK